MMIITMTVVMMCTIWSWIFMTMNVDAMCHIFVTLGRPWKHGTKGLFAWTGLTMMTALFIAMLQQDLLYYYFLDSLVSN